MIQPVSDFEMQRPLREGDQAIIDAVEQIVPGQRGDVDSNLILRTRAQRVVGTFGEVVGARVLKQSGRQEGAYIDIQKRGILAVVYARIPGSRVGYPQRIALPSGPDANSPEAQSIKVRAARLVLAANTIAE